MTYIVGVVCDGCGAVDADATVDGTNLEDFPRKNWISVATWQGQQEGQSSIDSHACSLDCLNSLYIKMKEIEHGHAHI
jgi:hypothetical protein